MASTQFGLIISTCGTSWQTNSTSEWNTIMEYARNAENLGFDSIWVMDHYWNPYLLDFYVYEALTTLSALSMVVRKVRLGTSVLCNAIRHPSSLATTIASLDAISNGRIDVGIGSGWGGGEAKMLGLPWPNYKERTEMLEESLQVLDSLLSGVRSDFRGKHYSLNQARIGPPSIQRPHPPFWIGGTSDTMLDIVARYGDGWLPEAVSADFLKTRCASLKERANKLGREGKHIRIGWSGGALRGIIETSREEIEKEAAEIFKTNWWGKPVSSYFQTIEELPWMIGTPNDCIERIDRLVKSGCEMIATGFKKFPSIEPMQMYAEKVMPHFKTTK